MSFLEIFSFVAGGFEALELEFCSKSQQQPQQSQQQIVIPAYDSAWVDSTTKKAALKLEKLDSDLKSAKSLAIKDCVKRSQEELADHFLDMGDLTNALKCYSRSRDYCSSSKHVINLCLNIIRVRSTRFRTLQL